MIMLEYGREKSVHGIPQGSVKIPFSGTRGDEDGGSWQIQCGQCGIGTCLFVLVTDCTSKLGARMTGPKEDTNLAVVSQQTFN